METRTVNQLSIFFGPIIGPCTILSNLIKLIKDIANILFCTIKSNDSEWVMDDGQSEDQPYILMDSEPSQLIGPNADQIWKSKKDASQHFKFIGIGILRTIPILGGIALCYKARAIA